MGDDLDGGGVPKTKDEKEKEEVERLKKEINETCRRIHKRLKEVYGKVCVKLDENLPRKCYLFFAMTFAVISSLLQLWF